MGGLGKLCAAAADGPRDPDGRFVGVRLRLYERETLVVGCQADHEDDAEQAAYYGRLREALRHLAVSERFDDVILVGDWNNVEDRAQDYASSARPCPLANPRMAGVTAMMRAALAEASSLLRAPAAIVEVPESLELI